ncbi:hypothetical protein A3D55_01915 [Candidatus Jorgensenbacteria bacterium RIFCSPHIGHO2_02_FULL_45_20]|uniref:UDP-N-acetylmuramoyl-tripeptide--D-alanyl-D-alanine ligase n=1 Tax=Candidatus Jorgensenbacteria bacterium RIFCSPHIGHO2_02_FULL_45_20 TaxID=1798470 RepID=A0A1F6BP90_9BACT|nr:MAG: hypothetical protein A3D55_01915 [Candidatus Jorgensenbacteria bacterium RIFCSPHIGHO2_02_FULL_45_20]
MKNLALSILTKTLKILARLTIKRYKPGVVGITGNVGKTSAKEAIGAVLAAERRTRASLKNFNNELGLPLSILGDWDKTGEFLFWPRVLVCSIFNLIVKNKNYPEILVLEYGVDRAGDMSYLLEIARPQTGVFTAIGEMPVHIEFFTGPEAIFREKARIISSIPATGFAVLNADDDMVMEAKKIARANVVTFGFSEHADLRITNFSNFVDERGGGISFKFTYGGSFVPVKINGALGRAPAYAAAAASLVGLIFGMNLVRITEALAGFTPPKGRQRIMKGIKNSIIIDDTYNSAPLAMMEALTTLGSLKAVRKIAVLGDMLELGKHTFEVHEHTGKLAAERCDVLFTVGVRGKIIAEAAERAGFPRKKIFTFMNIHEASMQIQQKIQKGDIILIKGSQGVRMERVVKEIMAEPIMAQELLVRQDRSWLRKPGLYD